MLKILSFFCFWVMTLQAKESLIESVPKVIKLAQNHYAIIQPLNHQAVKTSSTFKQEFYTDLDHMESNEAPLIIVLCGESHTCSGPHEELIFKSFVTTYGMGLIKLSHRFYHQVGAEHFDLRLLTIDQVLADIESFISQLKAVGFKGKVVLAGASYAGTLALLARIRYPQLVSVAYASSAPVKLSQYYIPNEELIQKHFPHSCWHQMKVGIQELVRADDLEAYMASLKKKGTIPPLTSRSEFINAVHALPQYIFDYDWQSWLCPQVHSAHSFRQAVELTIKHHQKFRAWEFFQIEDQDKKKASFWWNFQVCNEVGTYPLNYFKGDESIEWSKKFIGDLCLSHYGIDWKDKQIPSPTIAQDLAKVFRNEISSILLVINENDFWNGTTMARDELSCPNCYKYILKGSKHGDDFYLKELYTRLEIFRLLKKAIRTAP